MPSKATKLKIHNSTPPCECPDCKLATAHADQRRAELAAMFSRLAEVERLSKEAPE